MNARIPSSAKQVTVPIPRPLDVQVMRAMTRFVVHSYFRMDMIGRDRFPSEGEPTILVANHPSYIDPWLVAFGTERHVTWLALDEAFDWPVIGWMIKKLGAVPTNLDKASSKTLRVAYEVLRRGGVLGVFFERERTAPDSYLLNEPSTGVARIALRTGAKVVPATLAGARRAWPQGKLIPRPGKLRLTYHEPIDPKQIAPDRRVKDRAQLLTDRIAQDVLSALPPCGRYKHL